MKYNFTNGQLTFQITEGERNNIEIIKTQLLYDLDWFAEQTREELIEETETFITTNIRIEILERIKLDIILNTKFSKYFYKEKCFYINDNGHISISSNSDLFQHFVYAYDMLGEIDQGTEIAQIILKLSIIDRMIKLINKDLNIDEHFIKKVNSLYPFKDMETYSNFIDYTKHFIIDPYIDYSYLFQRLKNENYIEAIQHKKFAKWMRDQNLMTEKNYNEIIEKDCFYSFDKSTNGNRENNFNMIFKLT
tara:strand:- start:2085 stop:2831 length:747 start_codon:yes stop_codon:yes gene_type:complete